MSEVTGFAPAIDSMPNLYALACRLPGTTAIEAIGAAALLLLLWVVCRRITDLGMAGAAAVACGLLVGHHGLAADSALLIPLSVMTVQRQGVADWLKAWAFLMLSPAPMLIMWQKPLVWQMSIVGFVVTAVIDGLPKPLKRDAVQLIPDAELSLA
jgi:hypothetical protein